jgi:hypothetical protein
MLTAHKGKRSPLLPRPLGQVNAPDNEWYIVGSKVPNIEVRDSDKESANRLRLAHLCAQFRTFPTVALVSVTLHASISEMKPPLRIAILEADTPPDDIIARFGRYGKVFRTLLEKAADDLGKPGFSKDDLDLSAYDVVDEQKYPELDDVDAVLITGSSKSHLSS